MIKLDAKLFDKVEYNTGYDTFIRATTPPNCFGEVLTMLVTPAYKKPGYIEVYTSLDFKDRNYFLRPNHPWYYNHGFANSGEPQRIKIGSQRETDKTINFLVNSKAWEVTHVRERLAWLKSNPTKNSIDYFYYCKHNGILTGWEPNNDQKEVSSWN